MIRKSENSAASGEIEDCSAQIFFVIEHGGASSDVCEKSDLQTTSDLCYIIQYCIKPHISWHCN